MNTSKTRRRSVRLFYCGTSFYVKNLYAEWMPITDSVAKHYLIRGGFRGGKSEASLTECDAQLLTIRERDCVSFAGPIAGQKTGLLVTNGERVLVTKEAQLPIAKEGACPLWESILAQQYGAALPYVLEWHRQAYLRVLKGGGPFLPALGIAGKSGIGKTMTANVLTKNLLGGRVGKPFRYMAGETPFNSDLVGSELLLLDDVPDRMKIDKLGLIRSELKRMLADPTDSLHRKRADALTVPVVRATMICLNDEAHNLRFLPLGDSSMDDKLILVRVLERPSVLPDANDFEAERVLETKLRAEIPHLLWHLLHEFNMPKSIRWERGQPCYRHPELVDIAHEDDAVTRVMWLLDELAELPQSARTSPDWEKLLRKELGGLADRVLANMSLGHVLRDAAKRFPLRVQAQGERHGGLTEWRVQRRE